MFCYLHVFRIIHAFDRDKSRYRTMEKILKEAGVICVQTYNEDFLKVNNLIYNIDTMYLSST